MRNFTEHITRMTYGYPMSVAILLVCVSLLGSSCSQLEKPATQIYFSETRESAPNEFRWSNGSEMKTLDPLRATSAPESDVVKAVYEGLTDLDPKTFEAVPAIAKSWTTSEDGKVWSFILREDARWSNGDPVTAHDFVRSWRRAASLEIVEPYKDLLGNIKGLSDEENQPNGSPSDKKESSTTTVATDDFVLQVSLIEPDSDFVKILAHQMFRPVHASFDSTASESEPRIPITSGAYRFVSITEKEIVLEKSPVFWDAQRVGTGRVRFVMSQDAEQALDAYREGRLDAVTNFDFEPLALKLLSTYSDFRRSIHSAVNLYEFNIDAPPFNDERIREAFSLALERDRLVQKETAGAMSPATSFVPFIDSFGKTEEDVEKAKRLLAEAGFPEGRDFPPVTLVVNRNDLQLRIARAAARTWKTVLGVDVQIEIKELKDMEATRDAGSFNIIRRGIVFPTASAKIAKDLIFDSQRADETSRANKSESGESQSDEKMENLEVPFKSIALYFPRSYSLVKPSVDGFSINLFGATSVKSVSVKGKR